MEDKTKFKKDIRLSDWFTSNFDEIFKVKYLNNNSNNIIGLDGVRTAILLKKYLASLPII